MFSDAVSEATQKYSNSSFIIVDSELPTLQSNAVSILFEVDEASYILQSSAMKGLDYTLLVRTLYRYPHNCTVKYK